ncbi:hypothetical protein ACJW30_06G145100 [Castanea mollissima]
MSFTVNNSSFLLRGPSIKPLTVPPVNHLSCQKLRELFAPSFHLTPRLKILLPRFNPAQTFDPLLLGLLYFKRSTFTQSFSFSILNLQFSLANKDKFFCLAA